MPRTMLFLVWLVACTDDDDDKGTERDGQDGPDTDVSADTDHDTDDDDDDDDTDHDTDDDTDTEDLAGTRDDDGDGYSEVDGDCDDADPAVSPGATEICNDVDDDCNDDVDDVPPGTEGLQTWYRDLDGDGYGSDSHPTVEACSEPYNHTDSAGDCNDNDRTINPDAEEIDYNGKDEDCDSIDLDLTACTMALNSPTLYADDPPQTVRSNHPLIQSLYTESGYEVARWELDDGYVRFLFQGLEFTPTADPLVYEWRLTTWWSVGNDTDPFEFASLTQPEAADAGYGWGELSFVCDGQLTQEVVFEGEVEFSGWSTLDYHFAARSTGLTRSPATWSDFTFDMTYVADDLSAEGCTEANADMLVTSEGYASFADIYDTIFADARSRYLYDAPNSGAFRGMIEDACPQP